MGSTCGGMEEVGFAAARASGRVKSRQIRHEDATPGRFDGRGGLSAEGRLASGRGGSSAEGLLARGMGGGSVEAGFWMGNLRPELRPQSRADLKRGRLAGRVGVEADSCGWVVGEGCPFLDGKGGGCTGFIESVERRGGRGGVVCAFCCSAASCSFALASSSRLLGGRGGSLAWSRVGANTRGLCSGVSLSFDLASDVRLGGRGGILDWSKRGGSRRGGSCVVECVEFREKEDTAETSETSEAFEPFRGGRLWGVCCCVFRAGNGGGRPGDGADGN